LAAVVVKPDGGLATAAVYAACRPEDYSRRGGYDRTLACAEALRISHLVGLARAMTNSLEAAASRLHPGIGRLRELFERLGCRAHQLSGSGSAYFGLFETLSEARRVAETLRGLRVGKVCVTTIA
jgi:4-diphosphocytidyl-2-C-methyl-D-erythritol kinase